MEIARAWILNCQIARGSGAAVEICDVATDEQVPGAAKNQCAAGPGKFGQVHRATHSGCSRVVDDERSIIA